MPDHIEIPLQKLLVFEGDDLIFDGSDCSTCTVLGPDDITEACGRDREVREATDARTQIPTRTRGCKSPPVCVRDDEVRPPTRGPV